MNENSAVKRRAATVAIVSNSCLIVIKLAAGILTGSIGILSDAVHSLMDLVASVISLLSVRKADEPADASHRYGHEKLEDLSAGAQAILLLIGAAYVFYEAIRRLITGGTVESIGVGIVVVSVAAIVNLLVSAYLRRKARLTGSTALEATAADLHTDALVSIGVAVALVIVKLTGIRWIDPAVGLAIGIAISVTGIRILNGAARRLADETLPPPELERLQQVARVVHRQRGRRLPRPARSPRRQRPPGRPPPAVHRRHQPQARARDLPRDAARDGRRAARDDGTDPPRARGADPARPLPSRRPGRAELGAVDPHELSEPALAASRCRRVT